MWFILDGYRPLYTKFNRNTLNYFLDKTSSGSDTAPPLRLPSCNVFKKRKNTHLFDLIGFAYSLCHFKNFKMQNM